MFRVKIPNYMGASKRLFQNKTNKPILVKKFAGDQTRLSTTKSTTTWPQYEHQEKMSECLYQCCITAMFTPARSGATKEGDPKSS